MHFLTIILAVAVPFAITFFCLPYLITKMKKSGIVGRDVNKPGNVKIAQLGGLAALFGFSLGLSIVIGLEKIRGTAFETPLLAAISVFFVASLIGLIDDITDLSQRFKAIATAFAALPLALWHGIGVKTASVIKLPFGFDIDFSVSFFFIMIFWLVIVPFGITCAANALNMCAGYNGLESGQICIIAAFLILVTIIKSPDSPSIPIFAAVIGCGCALYIYNRYPARVFVGNTGTLGFGAVIGAATIISGTEIYGIIAISPAFYELGATLYYKFKKVDRKSAYQKPVILPDKRLKPPKNAYYYTLPYFILSRKAMSERKLVHTILLLYSISGVCAVLVALL